MFRSDWNGGTALYAPYDRTAIVGHEGWNTTHACYAWNGSRDIVWFLSTIHDLLNDGDYTGI